MRQRWNSVELIESWTLDSGEMALVANKAGASRLGFAVLLKFFGHQARFSSADEVPVEVVDFIARQVGVDFGEFGSYVWAGRSWKRHRAQVRAHFGFRTWSEQIDADRLVEALIAEADGVGLGFDELADAAYRWCRNARVEPPFVGQIHRLVRSADRQMDRAAFATVAARLDSGLGARLDDFAGQGHGGLAGLRADPGPPGVKAIDAELAKLKVIETIGVPSTVFDRYSIRMVDGWHDRFGGSTPSALAVMGVESQRVLTAAWVVRRRARMIDGIVDLLITVVHKIRTKAARRVEREQLADLVREYHTDGPALRSLANDYARSSYARH